MALTTAHDPVLDWSWITGATIALLALAFTIVSFWWLNARQGKLRSYEPHSFAFSGSPNLMLLRLPLVLYNTGAAPIVVQDLQMTFPKEPGTILPLPWRTTRSQLKPDMDDGHQFPAVFAVPGRQAQQHFIEFGGPFPGIEMEPRDYSVSIEVRLGHKDGWRQLLTFTLRAAHITESGPYITYSNSPFDLTQETVERSNQALSQLMVALEKARAPEDGTKPGRSATEEE